MNDQAHADPPPDAVERYPYGYAWRSRLQDERVLSRGEGTTTFSAVGEDRFRRQGQSLRGIASALDEAGYAPPSAERWSAMSVNKVLDRG